MLIKTNVPFISENGFVLVDITRFFWGKPQSPNISDLTSADQHCFFECLDSPADQTNYYTVKAALASFWHTVAVLSTHYIVKCLPQG